MDSVHRERGMCNAKYGMRNGRGEVWSVNGRNPRDKRERWETELRRAKCLFSVTPNPGDDETDNDCQDGNWAEWNNIDNILHDSLPAIGSFVDAHWASDMPDDCCIKGSRTLDANQLNCLFDMHVRAVTKLFCRWNFRLRPESVLIERESEWMQPETAGSDVFVYLFGWIRPIKWTKGTRRARSTR